MHPCDAVLLNQLDREVATKVLGIDLKPHRDVALAVIGRRHTISTGPVFHLRTGDEVTIPHCDVLRSPAGARDYNNWYFCFVGEFLSAKYPDIAAEVENYRLAPKLYSADIAAAFEVVTHLQERWKESDRSLFWNLSDWRDGWVVTIGRDDERLCRAYSESLPEAICKAALQWVERASNG